MYRTNRLLNEGPDAYKPELYGSRIDIQRKITLAGGSSFTLKNGDTNKTIETHKQASSELDRILKQFNISVTNPCCVLTQEESKTFIKGDEKNKYDFFLKATGLYYARESIKEVVETLKVANISKEDAHEKLEINRTHILQLKAKVDKIKNLLKLKDDINMNKAKLLWIEIYDIDANMIALQETIEKKEYLCLELKNKLVLAESSLTEKYDANKIEAKMNDINNELEVTKTEIELKKKAIDIKSKLLNENKNTLDKLTKNNCEYIKRLQTVCNEVSVLSEGASMIHILLVFVSTTTFLHTMLYFIKTVILINVERRIAPKITLIFRESGEKTRSKHCECCHVSYLSNY